ncbi:hypothetical protein PPL_04023 [Heterostelium album PN500]|uniref:Uncharacterized protein n=1 Tax=Heterostelium pallidum (strain ATCC 26659 / Pp 5 / PN500) TaxID=670386 RepID=D3B5T5_HETP5|nr:hypothetical protein PPL_04023 [Heterostelium album PN500]EFA83233.1 hypothetical protein PPL_04023 [Heterostelium album PN500]|eukprot:XP_020435350.1 hypothetical protein PPL_04023 [Heterostelium album PN500]
MNSLNKSVFGSIRTYVTGRQTLKNIGQKRGKDGRLFTVPPKAWDESLSSQSEAIIKAEQSGHQSFEQMQKMSVKKIQEEFKPRRTNLNA